jgi:signal transduction protein with GAF and PtsI domain
MAQWIASFPAGPLFAVPLVFGGRTVGVLTVVADTELAQNDLAWLRVLAVSIAATIATADAFRETKAALDFALESARVRKEAEQTLRAYRVEAPGVPRIEAMVRHLRATMAT